MNLHLLGAHENSDFSARRNQLPFEIAKKFKQTNLFLSLYLGLWNQ